MVNNLLIRPAKESDASSFLNLWNALDTETEFMLYEPGERKATLKSQTAILANACDSENVHILVLASSQNNDLSGFCAGRRSSNIRDRHVLTVVIGIRQAHAGKKWGYKLLLELERWAISVGISRLELNVMVNNERAVALYKSLGYDIEGTRRNSVVLRSGPVDEYMMAKLIAKPG